MHYDPGNAALDRDFDWELEPWAEPRSTALAKHAASAADDYEFDSWFESPERAIARTQSATAAAGLSDDIDLLLDTWEGAWGEAVPQARAAASTAYDASEHFDYDYELDLHLENERLETERLENQQHDHAVLFFDEEADRLREVVAFVSEGLAAGERVRLALTAELRRALIDALPSGLAAEAERNTQLTIVDARSTLAQLHTDGALDPKAFEEHVATSVRDCHNRGGGLRIYGEMVTLLWADGHLVAALELERLWNELQQQVQFSLLCAYPVTLAPEGSHDRTAIHSCHTEARVLQGSELLGPQPRGHRGLTRGQREDRGRVIH